jgi:hypothetical protein
MIIGKAIVPPRQSRLQRLLDRGIPVAALAVIGFSSVVLSVLLLRVAEDALVPPFSAAYTAGQNPWIAVVNRATAPPDAVAFRPTPRSTH